MSGRLQTIIIGAGLAGMAAALRLRRGFRLLERRDRPGGLVETLVEDGYRFDRTGHLLHLNNPRIRRMVMSLLETAPLRIDREARIFSNGVYTHYPFQANTYGLPPSIVAECLAEFIKARSSKHRSRPRTFEEFILWHFGAGIARHFMIPYNTKLWSVHPREITADWCRRFVPIPKVDQVISGAVGLAPKRMGYNAQFFYPSKGIGELSAALARRVGPIELQTAPGAIDFRRQRIRIRGQWVPYRAVVSTIPLPRLAALLVDPPERISKAAGSLRCTGLRYLDVALSRPAGNPYHWTYVPERKYPFYRVGCYSNFSSAMAPAGRANLYVELASRGQVRLDALMPRIVRGLSEMGLVSGAADIAFVRPRRIEYAYVVYDQNYTKAVRALLPWLESQRIFTAGRYARWEYAAMEDALAQGAAAAKKVKELD